jgi:23S rRNA pseudouridine1911/1915/1917 synthase
MQTGDGPHAPDPRAHAHIGHQLFNDAPYGGDRVVKGTVFTKYKQFVRIASSCCPRQALHAAMLEIDHPPPASA